ncbi:DUF3325 domain-containing protein [uncultured Acinetobacter sp.]|uniref:DUF3325 domain-containing protein n=1 Tax=uncultured Acinetobacter sp. TaxID=165433 RepID=UPI0026140494|nr:DUF3325 domain-containing protein [uncultured Acinetobacter sp.]
MSWFILVWALCNLGFIALACSMSKHQKQIFKRELDPQKTRLATVIGWILLTLGLISCLIYQDSISNMISYCLGVLSFSALAVGLSLSYFENHVKTLALASVVLTLISFALIAI